MRLSHCPMAQDAANRRLRKAKKKGGPKAALSGPSREGS
jgi:hypothetical protein